MDSHNIHPVSRAVRVIVTLAAIANPATAQIVPDGSLGTTVEPGGQTFEIDGGTRSSDGANLFHSFEQFGLSTDQIANFATTAEVQNVLGRVTGGAASIIDGTLQVTGSGADLFLMNPAGILFGENARLDVAGDFTATTAGAIEFESGWFEAIGGANWSEWVGDPVAFDFSGVSGENAGAIANFADLSVNGRSNLNLFAGTVINGGSLSGGNVSLTAVDAGQTLQLSAAGNVLGLDIAIDRLAEAGITPIALPELLTGGDIVAAGALEMIDGVVTLSGAAIESGDSVVTGAIDVAGGFGEWGGTVQVLGDRVLLAGAEIDATGELGGGSVYLGGEYRGLGTLPTAEFTVVDAESWIDASAIDVGDGGEVIVWADDTTGYFGEIWARGGDAGGDGGFVETSGQVNLVFRGGVDVGASQGLLGTVLLDPENIAIVSSASSAGVEPSSIDNTAPFSILANDFDGQDIEINKQFLRDITGNIELAATNNITLNTNLTFKAGDGTITFTANSDGQTPTGSSSGGAFFSVSTGTPYDITTNGRDITITGDSVEVGNLTTTHNSGGGDVSITANAGGITIANIETKLLSTDGVDAGDVVLTSTGGDIAISGGIYTNLSTNSGDDFGNGGNVEVTSNNGNMTIGNIWTGSTAFNFGDPLPASSGDAGTVTLISNGGGVTVTGSIDTSTSLMEAFGPANFASGNAGAVEITTTGGDVDVSQITTSSRANGINSGISGTSGNSGLIDISSGGGLEVGEIYAFSDASSDINATSGNVSDISLESNGGEISISSILAYAGASSNSGAVPGNVGMVSLSSDGGGITTGNISLYSGASGFGQIGSTDLSSSGNGGSLSFNNASNSAINVNGYIETYSLGVNSTAGDLTIDSGGDLVITSQITALGVNDGAKVDIQVAGDVNLTGGIDAFGVLGSSDTVTIGAFNSDRPDRIEVTSIETLSYQGTSNGGITLRADGDITVSDLLQSGSSRGNTPSPIIVDSANGNINIGETRSTAFGARTLTEIAGDYQAVIDDILATAGVSSVPALVSVDAVAHRRVLSLQGLITTLENLSTSTPTLEADSGTIQLIANNGSIDVETIATASETADSGAIEIDAGLEVMIDSILSDGETGSGDVGIIASDITITSIQSTNDTGTTTGSVSLEATDGSIDIDSIDTSSASGAGGSINAQATEDITVDQIQTQSTAPSSTPGSTSTPARGGNITLTAPNGQVNLTNVESFSANSSGGDVSLTGNTGINVTGNISSYGQTASGDLSVTSANNLVDLGEVITQSSGGPSGDIEINGNAVSAGNVSSIASTGSGDVDITATDGSVTTEDITTKTTTGSSGSVTVSATGDISTGDIESSTGGDGSSGDITATSETGSVNSGDITSESAGGNSGNINFSALIDVILGNLNSSGGQNSGDVNLNAGRDVTTGDITTQAQNGNSGDIGINAGRDILTGDLASIAENGISGNIALDAGRNLTTGSITTQDGTISLEAGGEINTGELSSDNDVLLNGEPLGLDEAMADLPAIEEARILSNTAITEARPVEAINIIQIDSSLNPNITSTTIGNETGIYGTNHRNSDLNVNLDALDNFSTDLLTFADTSLIELAELDADRSSEYTNRFGGDETSSGSIAATREAMARIEAETGIRTGASYISLRDTAIDIALLTADGSPITATVPVDRATLLDTIDSYRNNLISPRLWRTGQYNQDAAQLYDWLIRPIVADLEALEVDTLMLSMDAGLRGLPMAALYDGEQYLIENYSLSLIPSMGLIDTRYQAIGEDAPMLAMGASEFSDLAPLPGVPAELGALVNHRRRGEVLLNEDFTRNNIVSERDRNPYPIVHLATHGEFNAGDLSNSYIQLWDEKIGLDNIRELGWHDPAVELLVLSACRTALGNDEAEMGFAGLAVAAGVKTAIASLWYVDDTATFMLMTELYDHLATAPIKAEALRNAQLALLNGEVWIENGMLYAGDNAEPIPLPEEFSTLSNRDFSHPYFWSAFTAIGAPW